MSTILQALKRAEQDCPEQGNKNGSSLKFNVRTTLNSRMQRQRYGFIISPGQMVFAAGFVIVLAAAAYFLFFKDKKTFQPKLSPSKIVSKSSFVSPAVSPPEKEAQENDAVPEMVSPLPPVSPPVDEAISHFPKTNIKKTIPATISRPPSRQDKKKETFDNYPVTKIMPLKDGILKIQAISWSEDPLERIAVINNKVVGEGESVQSYRIITIEKDEVILRHSGQDFKLRFKYR